VLGVRDQGLRARRIEERVMGPEGFWDHKKLVNLYPMSLLQGLKQKKLTRHKIWFTPITITGKYCFDPTNF
jgi:hypothetical protein